MADHGDQKPPLRKYQTDFSKLQAIQKERAKYLALSLEEKMDLARMRGKPVHLQDVESWAMMNQRNNKKRGSSTTSDDINDKVSLWRGDITKLAIGAIVNAANSSLLGGGGVDGAIHRAAGKRLYNECSSLNGCSTGDAKMTAGYLLPAKYVLHTVGPAMHFFGSRDPGQKRHQLASCYQTCLDIVLEHNRKQRQILESRAEKKESKKDKENTDVQTDSKTIDSESENQKTATAHDLEVKTEESLKEQNSTDSKDQNLKDSKKQAENADVSEERSMEVDERTKESEVKEDESVEGSDVEKEVAEAKDEKSDNEKSSVEEEEDTAEEESTPRIQPAEPLIDAIAFPCISTGIYGYPQDDAAEVALTVCKKWLQEHPNEIKRIIFCVFLDSDYSIYKKYIPRFFPISKSPPEKGTSQTDSDEEKSSSNQEDSSEAEMSSPANKKDKKD